MSCTNNIQRPFLNHAHALWPWGGHFIAPTGTFTAISVSSYLIYLPQHLYLFSINMICDFKPTCGPESGHFVAMTGTRATYIPSSRFLVSSLVSPKYIHKERWYNIQCIQGSPEHTISTFTYCYWGASPETHWRIWSSKMSELSDFGVWILETSLGWDSDFWKLEHVCPLPCIQSEKCEFEQTVVEYMGLITSKGRVEMVPWMWVEWWCGLPCKKEASTALH